MATSGAMNTSNQYIKYTISITQNSQNIANNTSNVTVSVRFYRTNTGYTSYGTGTVYCKINGTTYSASVTPSQKITNSGIVLFSKTLDITHSTDGTKKLTCSAWISHDVVTSSEQSYTQTLTTIPRKSTLSVGNGTLGTEQTLTITAAATSFRHTIRVSCGNENDYIGEQKTANTTIKWTPPIRWATNAPNGTTVTVYFSIDTYSGSTLIGTNSYTKTFSIPSSVKPTCSISVTDETGYYDTYGAYIKLLSKFKVTITPTLAYGSPIASYNTTANGVKYTKASFTTGVLTSSGTQTISATVKDNRNRSGTATKSVTVLDYSFPRITLLKVKRCVGLEDGTEDAKGEYCQVTFSAEITALNNRNTAKYVLEYKKTTDDKYTSVVLSDFADMYEVTNGTYIFPAESGSSYNVRIVASDNFTTNDPIKKSTVLSTGFTLMHFLASGLGMAIGKVAELANVFDIGFMIRFTGGILQPVLEAESDFNDVITPNTYTLKDVKAAKYANCPLGSGTGKLKVETCGEVGQLKQVAEYCSKTNPLRYERFYYQGEWGEWLKIDNGTDSGWNDCTYGNNFARYKDTYPPLQVRRIGNVVHLRGVVQNTATVTPTTESSTLLGYFDSSFAPTQWNEVFVCQGSFANKFIITVQTNGQIYIARYTDSTATNEEIVEGSWLNCFATWFIG